MPDTFALSPLISLDFVACAIAGADAEIILASLVWLGLAQCWRTQACERPPVDISFSNGNVATHPMKMNDVLPPPRLSAAESSDKWERERKAFLRLRPSLLPTHAGRYVAIHGGEVVDSGQDEIALGLRVYSKFGYVPIYVGLVSAEPPAPVRIPSPRVR